MSRRAPKTTKTSRKTHARPVVVQGPLPVPRELLSAGIELDPDEEIARQQRMEALRSTLLEAMAAGRGAEALDKVMAAIANLERENERLAWRVLRANRYRFGRRTEKLSREELHQLVLALGGEDSDTAATSEPDVPVPSEPEQVDDPAAESPEPEQNTGAKDPTKKIKKRNRVRSMTIAPEVERKVTPVAVPEDERTCALCGAEKKVFGHVDHERIRFVPARIVVDVERREKMSCEHCRKDVSVAPRAQAPAVVRKVDASLLAKLVVQKTVMGLPLDRQRRELIRLGVDIPDKTLQSYWTYTTALIEPAGIATLSDVFGRPIVGADDSHLRTLDKGAKPGAFRGHLWCFVGSTGVLGEPDMVGYGYTPTWQADEIGDWFSTIEGFIQCDGYAGYSTELEDEDGEVRVPVPDEWRLGCGMHIRSKFHAALLAKDRRAAIPLKFIADLYQIEDDCKKRGLDAAARGDERQRRSWPIVDALDAWVDEVHPKLLPKSPLRIATTYAKNQREYFRRCFTDGRFEIDNGRVERRIRMFAAARRSFLFTGTPRGGELLAGAFTLVDNCLTLGIDPYVYMVDIIDRLERGLPARQLSSIIPSNWALEQASKKRAE